MEDAEEAADEVVVTDGESVSVPAQWSVGLVDGLPLEKACSWRPAGGG